MSHDRHKHAHCAHTHLAFCQHCQVVYCHDCAMEWTPKTTTWWYYSNTLPNTTYGTTTTYPNAVLCNEKPHTHGS